jgi:hypothetical protein
MASSLSERDFKTAYDDMLTFDSIMGREWLDPIHTKDLDINRCISFVTTVKQVVLHTTYQADGKSF